MLATHFFGGGMSNAVPAPIAPALCVKGRYLE